MNIIKENIDELNAVLKVRIEKDDYEIRVNDVLKNYRKKVNIDGFRPGKVPLGLINKKYRKPVLIEEINKIVSESISKYLAEEKLNILGKPIPSEKEQKPIDWDNQTEFEFIFDLGLAPEINIQVSKHDKLFYYDIKADDKTIDSYIANYTRRFGEFKSVDTVENNETLKGNIYQLNKEGNILENGISAEQVSFSLEMMKDEEIKKQFIGAKVNDIISFNLKKAYPNDSEIASILKIDKEEVQKIDAEFQFTVSEISKFINAEINQEFFDKVFGKNNIKSEEEFKNKIVGEIKDNLSRESDFKFMLDIQNELIQKANIKLPLDFLKKWLYLENKKKFTQEQIEKQFEDFEGKLKWQLIKDSIIKENEIKVTEEEIFTFAKELALRQYQQYGMSSVPDEHIENYVKELLTKEEEKRKLYEKKYENKIINFIKETVKVDKKQVSFEEFNKLFES